MKFFFDRSISVRIPKAIRIIEGSRSPHTIECMDDRFPGNTADAAWIAKLAEEKGWAVVTLDIEILRKPAERAAWREAKLTGFFLDGTWGNVKLDEFAWRLLRWWPIVRTQATLVAEGATFVVPKEGATLIQMP